MKIKSIEPIAISLPMLKPVIMATEQVHRADNVLVRIETDSGLVGWGEAASAPSMTGDTLESIVAAVQFLEPIVRGRDPADIGGALAAMDGRMYGNHGAKAAIEIALHDIAGRAANKPVHALLGDKLRSRMPLLASSAAAISTATCATPKRKKPRASPPSRSRSALTPRRRMPERTRAICKVLGAAC